MGIKGSKGIGGEVFFQAHRGGGGFERPDNTMVSASYGWDLGGIPELDVRRTADGRVVCLHDPTLRRTAPAAGGLADRPVGTLSYEEFRGLDVGSAFSPEYAEARVPLLEEILDGMAGRPERLAYLDLKEIGLSELAAPIAARGLERRVVVSGPVRESLLELKRILPGVGTMQWCGGPGPRIEAAFEESAAAGFEGLDQIQLHLNDDPSRAGSWRYTVGPAFLGRALEACARAGVDLEVLPWKFDDGDIVSLLDLGLRWFATDEPGRFRRLVLAWQAK